MKENSVPMNPFMYILRWSLSSHFSWKEKVSIVTVQISEVSLHRCQGTREISLVKQARVAWDCRVVELVVDFWEKLREPWQGKSIPVAGDPTPHAAPPRRSHLASSSVITVWSERQGHGAWSRPNCAHKTFLQILTCWSGSVHGKPTSGPLDLLPCHCLPGSGQG